MAKSLGLDVTAEGVETEAQLEYLSGAGCQYIQGYLMSKPVDWQSFLSLLGDDVWLSGGEY